MSERTDALIAELAGACVGMYADVIVNARHDLREIIATLERENAELKLSLETQAANFAELEQISGENIGELVFAQFENEQFRAHIQEAADRCQTIVLNFTKLSGGAPSPTHPQIVNRDWHLAALQPKEPTK